jgi:hypothetical protein
LPFCLILFFFFFFILLLGDLHNFKDNINSVVAWTKSTNASSFI